MVCKLLLFLDQLPKLFLVNCVVDHDILKEKFETLCPTKPTGKSDLPGIDMFWSIVIANTILSILAANYPVDKLSCYDSDDGKSLLTSRP